MFKTFTAQEFKDYFASEPKHDLLNVRTRQVLGLYDDWGSVIVDSADDADVLAFLDEYGTDESEGGIGLAQYILEHRNMQPVYDAAEKLEHEGKLDADSLTAEVLFEQLDGTDGWIEDSADCVRNALYVLFED